MPEAEPVDEHPIRGSNDADGRSTVQPAWMCFWGVGVIHYKLKLDDGAAGGRKTNKIGDETEEEDEFELVSGDVSRKCETPVSLLYFIREEDIAMQKFSFLLNFDIVFCVRCSHISMTNNIMFIESSLSMAVGYDRQRSEWISDDHASS